MKFSISESIKTDDIKGVVNRLGVQLKDIANTVAEQGSIITANSIQPSFGSINRNDTTVFTVQKNKTGILLIAEVEYKPSVAFWLILLFTLTTWVLWLLPIAFYMSQKNSVKEAILDVFKRVKDEFEQSSQSALSVSDNLLDLQKYAELKEKGHITEEEFTQKKKILLAL